MAKNNWTQKYKDKRGIPLKDVVMLYSNLQACKEWGCDDLFIGSFKNHDAWKHNDKKGGYAASVGAVFTDYQHDMTDGERICSLLCSAIQAMYVNPNLKIEKVVQELRKIDFFYCGAFPQIPGDHEPYEE